MRRFLSLLWLVALLPAPATAGVPYRDTTRAEWYLDAGPFPTLDAFFDATTDRRPLALGTAFNAERDPKAELTYLWAIEPDSSAWVQTPSGDMLLVDSFVLWTLGDFAEREVGYSTKSFEHFGYGVEDGRLYLYMSKSASVMWVLRGIAICLLIAGGLVVRLVYNLRRSQARERQLSESRRRIVDSREDERLGLARDLHDGPLQDLQALRMQLGVAEHSVNGGGSPDVLRARVVGVQDELLRVIGEVRQISEGLRPPVLSSFGLVAALRALVTRLQDQTPGVRLDLQAEGSKDTLSESTRLTLYRVAQESVNNALEHSGCSTVSIRFWQTATSAHLAVEDDGHGFAVPPELHVFERDGHLGLAGMAERAESLGGTLSVHSSPEGTRVYIRVPAHSHTLVPA